MLPELEVTVVYHSDLPPIGVGESTTSAIPSFLHDGLKLDRKLFYSQVRPTWKLGLRFDWGRPESKPFYYPFDRSLDGRTRALGKEHAYYCFADGRLTSHFTEMMERGKAPCVPNPVGGFDVDHCYGYHIDNRAFIDHLQSQAAARGVRSLDREVSNVEMDEDGSVQALLLEDESRLTGDLFVDCSGFVSKLLGQSMNEPFDDFGGSLFCDRAVTGGWRRDDGVLPYTMCQTMDHGWCWQIELIDQVNRGYVFSSQFCSEEDAIREMKLANPEMEDEFGIVKFRSGRYERFWVKNVAAIGNAAGFVEPLEATGLHMAAVTARTLGQVLVDTDRCVTESLQREVNRFVRTMWDDIRNFLAIHFAFNFKRDTPFWRQCQQQTDLAGAREIVDFYRDNGPSSMGNELVPPNSVFRYAGYLGILIGQGVESGYVFDVPAEEQQHWQLIGQRIQAVAEQALTMDDGLRQMYSSA